MAFVRRGFTLYTQMLSLDCQKYQIMIGIEKTKTVENFPEEKSPVPLYRNKNAQQHWKNTVPLLPHFCDFITMREVRKNSCHIPMILSPQLEFGRPKNSTLKLVQELRVAFPYVRAILVISLPLPLYI